MGFFRGRFPGAVLVVMGFLGPHGAGAAAETGDPGAACERAGRVAGDGQDPDDDSGESPVDLTLRLRGRFIDEASDLGDVQAHRPTVWSDTRLGSRIQVRATWDLAEHRAEDLWAQYDFGNGFRVRAGRSSPAWLSEYTDSSYSRQMVRSAVGAALTRSRETGVFLFFGRDGWNGRLHLVNGSGWVAEDNGFKDIVASGGRSFEAGGLAWTIDVGHYEGRDGADEALTPRRQSGVQLDADLGAGRFLRGAFYRSEQDGQEHFGGFFRGRRRFPGGVWGALELGSESNNTDKAAGTTGAAGYFLAGVRFELPWTNSHLSADYRRRFGLVADNEVLLVFQWILDFREPRR